jgi:hypothetical protein
VSAAFQAGHSGSISVARSMPCSLVGPAPSVDVEIIRRDWVLREREDPVDGGLGGRPRGYVVRTQQDREVAPAESRARLPADVVGPDTDRRCSSICRCSFIYRCHDDIRP